MIFATGLVVAIAAVGASAQDLSGLSASCQTAATSILSGPASTCLGMPALMKVAMTPVNQSLVDPINNWLSSTCPQPACTNATIDSLFANVTSGCASDLNAANVTSDTLAEIKEFVEEWYPVGREVACLKDTSNSNAYCIYTTLKDLESYIGVPLSITNINLGVIAFASAGGAPPKNITCTPCIQGAYALIRPHLNESNRGTWDTYLGGQCGSSFTNGTSPTSIIQSANSAAPESSHTSGATSLKTGVFGLAVVIMLGGAGAVAVAL